ncbi:MAG: SRPBCC family protein [Balneolaceae bacterium]|nr:SRPBCC family protein [Balneolaceae bacterium]
MHKAKVSGTIEAPSDDVWKLAGNFGELNRFVEAITGCITNGSGVGAERTLYLQDGGKVKEKLESLDNDQKKLTYSIVESPMPIEDYIGTIQVKELDENHSEFTWSSTFNVADEAANEMKEVLEGLYELGVEGLKKHF